MTYHVFEELLQRRLEQKRFRHLHPFMNPSPIDPSLNFAHQDLFFLSEHEFVKRRAIDAVAKWGSGFHHSRSLASHLSEHAALEEQVSSLLQRKHTFLLNAAEPLHEWILSKLSHPKSCLFIDQNLRVSPFQGKGPILPFDRRKLQELDSALAAKQGMAKVIALESLSSQTGDLWDETKIKELAEKHGAFLYVDDSSAFGIHGVRGLGLARSHADVDMTIIHLQNTFSLPLAALSVSPFFHDFLHHYLDLNLSAFPLYPSLLGAFQGTLELFPDLEEERGQILRLSESLRQELIKKGWNVTPSKSHIVSLEVATQDDLASLSHYLASQGILVLHPQKQRIPNIRIVLHARHTAASTRHLLHLLSLWKAENP